MGTVGQIVERKHELLDPSTTRACRIDIVLGPEFTPNEVSYYYTIWWSDLKTRTFRVAVMPTQRIRRRR
jgi:hypothetical protein